MFTGSVMSDMISRAFSESVNTCLSVMSMYHMYLFASAVKITLNTTTMAINAIVNSVAVEPYLNFLDWVKLLFMFPPPIRRTVFSHTPGRRERGRWR